MPLHHINACYVRSHFNGVEIGVQDRLRADEILRARMGSGDRIHARVGGLDAIVYPTDRPAYARLCRLLSLGEKRGGKAKCRLERSDVAADGERLIAVLR